MNLNQLPRVQYDLIRLGGGLDQVTPTLILPPGFARRAANFECNVNGGYTRIAGYERFDGRDKPSAAFYNILVCTLTGSVAVGNTVQGLSSAATGKVIAIDGGNLALTREVGTFVAGEAIAVSSVNVGTIDVLQGVSGDGYTDALYRSLAANEYRSSIQAVPGAGPVRGVVIYKGDVYAWRNNVGNTMLGMYKSSSSGWTAVPYYATFDFAVGTQEMFPGETIVGHTSGATALLKAVVVTSGSWSTGDAAGYAVFTNMTGTPVTNEWIYIDGIKHAEYRGAYAPIAPLPNGRVEAVIANFGGSQNNKRIYWCDGVNTAFEFDGETVVPIRTTMSPDAPTRVAVHKQHLFLAFNHSLQFSGISNPFSWDPVLGAGEIAMNDTITNLLALPGDQSSGALAVYTKSDTSVLYGTSSENFALSTFNIGTGAYTYTAQSMDQAYVLDDRGVMSLGTSLNFGNFLPASLTMNLRPFIEPRITLACASSVNRDKGQYRVFFSDGTAVYMTVVNGKLLGSMPIQFADPALCCFEGEAANGRAVSFFGSNNGFVYQMDVGTSFDGEAIPASINLIYNSMKSPRILKRFRKASVELAGDYWAEIQFGCDLGYRNTQIPQGLDATYNVDMRSSYWDSMIWDNFVWDGSDITPSEVEIEGVAENIGIRISSNSDIVQPFTVNTIIVHYTLRRGIR